MHRKQPFDNHCPEENAPKAPKFAGLCGARWLFCARKNPWNGRCSRRLELQKKGAEIVRQGDPGRYSEHNLALHDLLYRGSQNEVLEQQVRALRKRLEPYRRYSFQLPNRIEESHAEHTQIIASIIKGDSESAEAQMRSHMNIQRPEFLRLSDPAFKGAP